MSLLLVGLVVLVGFAPLDSAMLKQMKLSADESCAVEMQVLCVWGFGDGGA